MRIDRRTRLIVTLVAGQFLCLLLGLGWFLSTLEGEIRRLLERQILADNQEVAAQLAELLAQVGIKDLRLGTRDWERTQTTVEKLRLPNDGFLCIISTKTGELVCHPELRRKPDLQGMKPGLALSGLEETDVRNRRGVVQMPDGTHLVAVRELPSLGVMIAVHQRQRGLDAAVGEVTRLARNMGLLAAGMLLLGSTLVTAAIAGRYENQLATINAKLETLVKARTAELSQSNRQLRRQMAARQESEERFTLFVQSVKDYALIMLDPQGSIVSWNTGARRITGHSLKEILGQPASIFHTLEDRKSGKPNQELDRAREVGRAETEGWRVRQDGSRFWAHIIWTVMRDQKGEAVGYALVMRDITAPKQAEETLRLRDRALSAIAEGLAIVDLTRPALPIMYCNPTFESLTGLGHGVALDQGLGRLFGPASATDVVATLQQAIREPQQTTAEIQVYGRDSTPFWCLVSLSPVRNTAGPVRYLVVVLRDLTEHKRLEEQLRCAQKQEAIGRLAGGVAHDFNNLLTVILMSTEMVLSQLPAETKHRSILEEVRKAGEQAAALTRQLLAFSRKQVLQPRVLDLHQVLDGMTRVLRRLIGEHIELTVSHNSDLVPVKADPAQIEQVLLNLVVNARDAMPGGGRLTITAGNFHVDVWRATRTPELHPGMYAVLTVNDTGHGMDEATQARIFEPFFTTKATGQGTGLGLATVYGIVKQSGGAIEVRSQSGNGSIFRVFLPQAEEAKPAEAPHELETSPPSGQERILLVEDEPSVRAAARQSLQQHGYAVLEAGSGDEALQLLGEEPAPIDLLVTDVVMPRMSGCQLAEAVAAQQPDLPVLFISGHAADVLSAHALPERPCRFLQKPFTPQTLAIKVREALDGGSD